MAGDLVIEDLRCAFVGPVGVTVPAGTCAAIAGDSGAGKSLLLRMIADLDPNTGRVRLGGLDRATMEAPDWRRRVCYVAAEAGWWAATVDAHLPPATMAAARDLATKVGLSPDHLTRPVATLSTGEKQRLALVRALVRIPDALLLDEPTSALDPTSTARVEALLRETLARGTIIVLVSHDTAQGQRLGGTPYRMDAGRLMRA